MVAVVKWLRQRIVIPSFAGSTPVSHPIFLEIKFKSARNGAVFFVKYHILLKNLSHYLIQNKHFIQI